jgi:asparagine synthase (glutamine-hydrolysing)
MCGIAGAITAQYAGPQIDQIVSRMTAALIHRGPDDAGAFVSEQVIFGFRRLSIIDLTRGAQPIFNEDRSVVLICNGEIYNYIELRRELEDRGHRFAAGSDCETIVHLYEEIGERCVERLRGMFAFALYDVRRSRVLLARDRIGEKPLYLCDTPGALLFASELKAILSSGLISFELDDEALNHYLHYQYVPEPRTLVRGIWRLPAAHYLIANIETGEQFQRQYWSIQEIPPNRSEPGRAIRSELEQTADLIVRSDVPVGIALSGGMDSSTIAALLAHRSRGRLKAFSIGYPGYTASDESREAERFAQSLELEYHRVEITPSEVGASFRLLVSQQDEPVADIAASSYAALARTARDAGVSVLIQGHGGDEWFWGYPWARAAVKQSRRKAALQAGTARLSDYLHFHSPDSISPYDLRSWVQSACGLRSGWNEYQRDRRSHPDQLVFYDLTAPFHAAAEGAARVLTETTRDRLASMDSGVLFRLRRPWRALEIVTTALMWQTYLLGNGITLVDRLSMAFSVESRLPLLDYRLVETIIGLRKAQTDVDLEPKAWLKSAVADLVPREIRERPKRGFAPPVQHWYQAIFARCGDDLAEGYLVQSDIIRRDEALRLVDQGNRGRGWRGLAFPLLVLETWCRFMSSLADSAKQTVVHERGVRPGRGTNDITVQRLP